MHDGKTGAHSNSHILRDARALSAAQRALSHSAQARSVHLLHARRAMVSLTFSRTGVSRHLPPIQEPCDGNR